MQALPPAGHEAEIISMLDIPSSLATRLGKMDVMITYRIDPMHSFTITVPKEKSTREDIMVAINADWKVRREIIGAKFTLP